MQAKQARIAKEDPLTNQQLVPMDRARNRLATLWLSAAALIFATLSIQSLRLVYGASVQEVWGWILPTLMPTLGMIVTVLGYTAVDEELSKAVVRRSFLAVAFWLSFCYLLLILMTIAMQPLSPANPVDLMRMSNLWLGPFQGLVASALGVLFVTKRQR